MIESRSAGEFNGLPVHEFTLDNGRGMRLSAIEFGATLTTLHAPDRTGRSDDVVLGLATLDDYIRGHPCLGSTAGRCANRIRGASFTLDDRTHMLGRNDGPHHLHGGATGFHRRVWKSEAYTRGDESSIRFELISPDGDEGYPGTLRAAVIYTLTAGNEFRVEMEAETDAPTVVNLVHHSYWNLGGHASGSISEHVLRIDAGQFTPHDAEPIPTGEIAVVEGTPFDFRSARDVGSALRERPDGYDVNFVLRPSDVLKRAALLTHPPSGRTMELFTTEPGLQLYSGNDLNRSLQGKSGARYDRFSGICLESQKYPDAIHHPHWPSPILRPGERYSQTMLHRFAVAP